MSDDADEPTTGPSTASKPRKGPKKSKSPKAAGIDKNRKYDAYFASMARRMDMRTNGDVNNELDKMLRYVLAEISATSNSILSHYAKKTNTVRPNMAHTALTAILNGDLRSSVTNSGTVALSEFVNKSKRKGSSEDAEADAASA
jgi:hypothetical protein